MTGFLILAFLILVASVVAVPLASRFGLGSVLGYLLAGMAISPLLAALRVDVEALQVFAEFGVVMMLFIVGLELEPKRLWEMRGKLFGLGGGQVLLTTLAIASIVVKMSYVAASSPVKLPGLMCPGHRTMAGMRIPPSRTEPLKPRRG